MKIKWVKRVVAVLVVLNVVQLLIFFFQSSESPKTPTKPSYPAFRQGPGKSWQNLPSFASWSTNTDLPPNSCEAFFGNGFTQTFHLLTPVAQPLLYPTLKGRKNTQNFLQRLVGRRGIRLLQLNEADKLKPGDVYEPGLRLRRQEESPPLQDGLFRCFFSETLQTSVCEGRHMIMDPKHIKMSKGGEPLDSIIGRDEEEELPSFTSGAFQVVVAEKGTRRLLFNKTMLDHLIPRGRVQDHTLQHLFEQIRTVPLDEVVCDQRVSVPTLVVTRFEYANLFHTVTDWYSAYMTSRIANLENRPSLLLVDGHCKSPMDIGWQALFSGVNFAKHFTGPICFDHLIFAPLGYDSPLFKGLTPGNPGLACQGCGVEELREPNAHKTARMREFGEMFISSFNFTPRKASDDSPVIKVLFVRREDYLAHPRHTGKPESRLSNEEEVLEALNAWAANRNLKGGNDSKLAEGDGKRSNGSKINVVNGLLAHMTMKEQLHEVQEASIIVGAHGAGLSHVVFARPGKTAILELVNPYFARPHFAYMSQWMGIQYHSIQMGGSVAGCAEVIETIDRIFTGLRKELGTP